MKKTISILALVILVGFTAEKDYSFKLNEGQVNMLYNTLQASKQVILKSDIPVRDAVQIVSSIDSMSKIIVVQYNAQAPKPEGKK